MKKIVAAVLIVLFVVASLGTASADELDQLRKEQDVIQRQMEEERRSLQSAQRQFNSLSDQVRHLENELSKVERELATLNRNVKNAEDLVKEAEAELIEIENELQERVDLFKERLRQIYQRGDVNFFEVLTQSSSITDFLVRFELLKKIAEQDMNMVEEIDRQRLIAEEKKEELEKKRDHVVLLKKQSEAKLAQLETQKKEQQDFLAQVRQEKSVIERALAELEEDSNKLAAEIRRIQLSRSRSGLSAPTGKFAWPTPGYNRITSDYGMRVHPILRTQRMHTGIDISAPMGSPAVAGEVGEVIYTGWFGGYGWTVVVDHGGGVSSMYPHLSRITVKEGDIVARGQEVGKIGTSGLSTGPHMHFEVRENGDPVNPWPYLR
ncbi:murein hydrolase activator EnvC family protein [Desulfitibacter alkalitolerans]|uniref:murein hydrolase activator EnvC family protein n=1 Tax=Desulfitibacter alkalitolerans TaxID=264641 RepID=UPI000481E983|nr:peptidoglycan DD-metalloendopeptidase family protein [Desulfitibacter alkalitolerans]